MSLGPLFFMVPIAGSIPIFLGSLFIFCFRKRTTLSLIIISFLVSFFTYLFFVLQPFLGLIAVGMIFHSVGIIIANIISPIILKRLDKT
jgi:Na+/proline symporter